MSKDFCNFTPWKNDLLTFHPAMNFNHVESVLIDYRLQYLLKISINWLIAVFTENAQELIVTSLYLLWYIDLFEASPLLTTFIISISKIKLWYFLLFIFFRILAFSPFKGIVKSSFIYVCLSVRPALFFFYETFSSFFLTILHSKTKENKGKFYSEGKRRNRRGGGLTVIRGIILKGEGDEQGRTFRGWRKYHVGKISVWDFGPPPTPNLFKKKFIFARNSHYAVCNTEKTLPRH